MGSETTAAAGGQQGVVRRDPFAMLPFMGYNMADYFAHWLNMGAKLQAAGAQASPANPTALPRIYCANWFRKGADGQFVWPGYGENMRVLEWILGRVAGTAQGQDNVFGVSPQYQDLRWDGLAFTPEQYTSVTHIDPAAWQRELALHSELFAQLHHQLPAELPAIRNAIEARLLATEG
jgi:phosphoenolpyruvate carboxykinase (GTP)